MQDRIKIKHAAANRVDNIAKEYTAIFRVLRPLKVLGMFIGANAPGERLAPAGAKSVLTGLMARAGFARHQVSCSPGVIGRREATGYRRVEGRAFFARPSRTPRYKNHRYFMVGSNNLKNFSSTS